MGKIGCICGHNPVVRSIRFIVYHAAVLCSELQYMGSVFDGSTSCIPVFCSGRGHVVVLREKQQQAAACILFLNFGVGLGPLSCIDTVRCT